MTCVSPQSADCVSLTSVDSKPSIEKFHLRADEETVNDKPAVLPANLNTKFAVMPERICQHFTSLYERASLYKKSTNYCWLFLFVIY